MKALICEEERVIGEIISKLFKSKGYDVVLASNTIDAINVIKNQKIELLVTDMKLAIEQQNYLVLSARKVNPKIDVLMLSALYTDQEIEIMEDLDIEHLLEKPFTRGELEDVLQSLELTKA